MKIALLLYGQPRFLNNPASYTSYKEFLMDRHTVDVFCHFWFDPDERNFLHSDFSAAPGGCSAAYNPYQLPDTENFIVNRYKPKKYICEKPKTFSIPEPMPKVFADYAAISQRNANNFISQLYSWEQVLQLFASDEKCNEYDWVFIGRYDCGLTAVDVPESLGRNMCHTHPTGDIMFLPPNLCETIKPYTNFDEYIKEATDFDVFQLKRIAITRVMFMNTYDQWKFDLIRGDVDANGLYLTNNNIQTYTPPISSSQTP